MPKTISIQPIDMTPEVMQDLEDRGLILRLCPGRHELNADPGQTAVESLYESDSRYGGHKLIAVTVNRSSASAFGTHPDNEDILLLGDPATRPLYLIIAWHRKDVLEQKIQSGQLSAEDFLGLRVRYNDPEVSFFTMLKDIPHDEVAAAGEGRAPSFYVTEPCSIRLDFTEFGDYQLQLTD